MMRVNSGTFTGGISDYEEQVWLLQQQNPDRVLKHIVSWQICDSRNIAKLLDAIRRLIEDVPDLNARYNLSDDGELIKYHSEEWLACIEFSAAKSYPAMVEYILASQAAAWDPESDTPFKALVTCSDDQVVLSLILHDIVAPMANGREIVRFLQRACSGEQALAFSLKRPALPLLCEQYASPVPGLRRPQGMRAIIPSENGCQGERDNRALATRWKTTISVDSLHALSVGEEVHHAVRVSIILHFAHFIARLSGQKDQALCLLSEDGPRYLNVNTAEDDALLAAAIVDKLRLPVNLEDPAYLDADTPWVYVRLLPDAVASDEKQPWPGEPVLLPTCAQCPDIELALEVSGGKSVTLVLTLGQAVYSSLGESLLDRLVAFLQGDSNIAVDIVPAAGEAVADDVVAVGVNAVAEAILSEFRTALSAPDMSLTDDFFDYGGHSLLATRVIGRLLSNHGLEVHFGDFFSYPSAAALAPHAVPSVKPATAPISQHPIDVTAPLALAQRSLWEAYKAYDFGTIFNLPFALDLLDAVDETLLEKALTDIIERHASLRSLFLEKNGEACQHVVDMAQLANYKWFWYSGESLGVTLEEEAAYRFDLTQELPLRIRVLHNPATGRQALSLLVQHMAIDEWSLNVIMEELSHAYAARAADKAPVWQKPALAFHEFALRQQADGVNQQHLAFWNQMLRDVTRGLTLPESAGHAAIAAGANPSAAGWLEYRPRPEVTRELYALARQNNASLFTVIYAAIALVLHKLGNLSDIAIGTSASGRTDQEAYETVGYFTTMVAHRVKFDPEQPVKAFIADVRDTINNSMQYADVPMDIIQQSLGIAPEEGLLFDVYIQIHASNALNGVLSTPSGQDIRYRQIDADKKESMFGLQFEIMEDVIEGEKTVRLVITYRSGRYPEPLVKRISEAIDSVFVFFTMPESLNTPLERVAL